MFTPVLAWLWWTVGRGRGVGGGVSVWAWVWVVLAVSCVTPGVVVGGVTNVVKEVPSLDVGKCC